MPFSSQGFNWCFLLWPGLGAAGLRESFAPLPLESWACFGLGLLSSVQRCWWGLLLLPLGSPCFYVLSFGLESADRLIRVSIWFFFFMPLCLLPLFVHLAFYHCSSWCIFLGNFSSFIIVSLVLSFIFSMLISLRLSS
uniref:Uncharacterized protein n=1 Tax=Populus trichocarpa TaxID=3694 RepID=A0A2K1ZGP0_POPTR